jgi:hypothetical protein
LGLRSANWRRREGAVVTPTPTFSPRIYGPQTIISGKTSCELGQATITTGAVTNGERENTEPGAENLMIKGNNFGGTGFALAHVNRAINAYAVSANVKFIKSAFTGIVTAGADISDGAASGNIWSNAFYGSGKQAIFLDTISTAVANAFNAAYRRGLRRRRHAYHQRQNRLEQWRGRPRAAFDGKANSTVALVGGARDSPKPSGIPHR